jgi:hypothetical protein
MPDFASTLLEATGFLIIGASADPAFCWPRGLLGALSCTYSTKLCWLPGLNSADFASLPTADTPGGHSDRMSVLIEEISICTQCDEHLEHCHGTAIIHFDGSYDCSDDPECRLSIESHRFSFWEEE